MSNIYIVQRSFGTSCNVYKNYLGRQQRVMNKLINGSSGKRKWYNQENKAPILPNTCTLTKGAFDGGKSVNSKRITVLNKLFMKNITDLMATGSAANEFVGKGIEVSRVQITPDFHEVKVYWLAKGSPNDESLDAMLVRNAGALRHELSQLRLMGVVPKITFVKDKLYAKQIEVDVRLAVADFGEDFEPVEPQYRLKTEFMLNTPLSQRMRDQIEVIDASLASETPEEPLPAMRMDTFGLNHAVITEKIQRQVRKSKALHRMELSGDSTISKETPRLGEIYSFETMKSQREAFAKFLNSRMIMRAKKARGIEKNYQPEMNYLHEEMEGDDNDEILEVEDDDYIEETDDHRLS